MNFLTINQNNTHPKVLLVLPEAQYDVRNIFTNYLAKLGDLGKEVQVCTVKSPDKGRLSHATFAPEDEAIKGYCELKGIEVIVTPIAEYLRMFLGSSKKFELERSIGTAIEHEGYTYIPTIHFSVLRFAPQKYKMLDNSMRALTSVLQGDYTNESSEALKNITYIIPRTIKEAKDALTDYMQYDKITCDIETTGLTWATDTLITVSFASSQNHAVCIAFKIFDEPQKAYALLKNFFKAYKGKLIFHNGVFDVPFLVYRLFMKDLDDHMGMLEGVNCFNMDDTIIMAYLCLNSTERPELGLKALAFSAFGDWDRSIDQSKLDFMPIDEVCRYNAIDCMATMYLYDKYSGMLKTEEQLELYENYYRKAMLAMIKLKMSGLVLDREKVLEAYDELDNVVEGTINSLQEYKEVQETISELNKKAMRKYNETHKKQKSLEEFSESFKPSSTDQKRLLLFDIMGLHTDKKTGTGEFSTDKEVLNELLEQTSGVHKEIIQKLVDIAQASVIRNTFLASFKDRAVMAPSGIWRLYGDYKLYGTASGRLSSANP